MRAHARRLLTAGLHSTADALPPTTLLGRASASALGYYPATIRGQTFRGDTEHARFWHQASVGQWEPETFDVFDRFLTPETIFYDVGAWIGPTVLYAARTAKQVHAFEPDPAAYECLLRNLRLNGVRNVQPYNVALTDRDGVVPMSTFGSLPGDSQTSILNPGAAGATTALGLTWETWHALTNAAMPTVMKMDVEGAEFGLLPTLRPLLETAKPVLYLSTHAPYLPEHERAQALRGLRDALAMYDTLLDAHMQPVPFDALERATTFAEFVLT